MDSCILAITVKSYSYHQENISNGVFAVLFNENGDITKQHVKLFEEPQELVHYIQNITCDSTVIMGTMGTEYKSIINNDSVKRAIMTLGSCLINTLKPEQSWALVGTKGSAPGKAEEMTDSDLSCNIPTSKNKFTTTVSAISTHSYAEIYVEGTAYKTEEKESLLVVVLDENSLEKLLHNEFNRNNLNNFVEFISSLDYGKIVAVALNGKLDLTPEVKETCKIIGSGKSDQIEEGKSWTIIGYKGADPGCVVEVLSEVDQPAHSLALLPVDPLCCDGVNIISSSASTDSMQDSTFVSIGGIDVSESDLSEKERGICLIVIEPSSGAFEEKKVFNVHASEKEASNLVEFVQNIPVGKIVAGFLQGKGDFKYLTDKVRRVLQQIGSTKIWDVTENSSWATVGRKGCAPGSLPEIQQNTGVVAVQLTCQFMTCLFARPYYSLYATSSGMGGGGCASIRMENSFILNANETNSGLHVAVLDSKDYDLQSLDCFDTNSSESKSEEFAKFIAEQTSGSIIVVVVNKKAIHLTDSAKEIIASLGSKHINELREGGSWCLISAKGCPGVSVEALSNTTPAHCHMCLPIWGVDTNQEYAVIKAQSQKNLAEITMGTEVVQRSKFQNTIALATIDPVLWKVEYTCVFYYNEGCVQKLKSELSTVRSGKVVVAAGCGDISKHFTEQSMYAVESIGSGLVQSINKDSSWVLVGIKSAAPGSVCESLENKAVVSLCVTCPSSTEEKNTETSSMAENKSSDGSTKPSLSSSSGIPTGKAFSGKDPESVLCSSKPSTTPPSGSSREVTRKVLLAGITYQAVEWEEKMKLQCPPLIPLESKLKNRYEVKNEDLTKLLDHKEWPKKKWPSKINIEAKLNEYCELAKLNSDSVFLFYFFGHGREDRLIALHRNGNYPEEITKTDLMTILRKFPEDCNITFVIHSCRSGGMFEVEPDPHPTGFAFTSCSALASCSVQKVLTNRKNFTIQFLKVFLKKQKPSYTEVHEELKNLVKEEGKHKIVLSRLLQPPPSTYSVSLNSDEIITQSIRVWMIDLHPINNNIVEVMLPLHRVNEKYETTATEIIGRPCYLTAKKELFNLNKFRLKYLEAVNLNDTAAEQSNIIGSASFTYETQEDFSEDIITILKTLSDEFREETDGEVVINQVVLSRVQLDLDSYDSTPKMFWNQEINDPKQLFLEPRSTQPSTNN